MPARVSIAMTTFNGERYLPAQLDSFQIQSRLPDELVVCDDGSSDATLDLLEEFSRSANFEVRIIRNPRNLGHERNFSQAINLCTGDIIFLSDQDDAWFPEKIRFVEGAFAKNPAALLVVHDAVITDGSLVSTGRTVIGQMRAAGVLGKDSKSLTLGCATSFRSSLRQLVSPVPSLNFGHDSWLHDFTHVLGGRLVLEQPLQLYRRHGENASTWAFNGSARATPFVMMRPTSGQDLSPMYENRVRALSLMRGRVEALGRERFGELRCHSNYDEVLTDLSCAIGALQRRTGVFRLGWFGRKQLAFRLLVGGDYQYFLGWRSFLKDLIR
jgi:hypothetical protein